ncbi:MAG TPA: hypothetical protein DEU93_02580, partial [Chitinophagaceae bacterium]|nr:hypothetical protein [Chitinophagaceae bacterium]HML59067.1 hypothetical protein [Ferruginibacter sp.]
MKKLIVGCFVFIAAVAQAQTPVEFIQLLQTVLPDAKSTARTQPWPAVPHITFKNKVPAKRGTSYCQSGTASILVNGKK